MNEMKIDLAIENWIQSAWEDFDLFVSQRNWTDATALMEAVGENGFETDAIRMNHILNRESKQLYYEAIEDSESPFITPEEDDAPEFAGAFPEMRNELDKLDKN